MAMNRIPIICAFVLFISSCGYSITMPFSDPYAFTIKFGLSGNVYSKDGTPVSGATVKLFMDGSTREYVATTTDSTGYYSSLVPGDANYTVVASRSGDSGQSRVSIIASSASCDVTFDRIPDIVKASADNGAIRLYWEPASWATSYNVYYGTTAGIAMIVAQTTAATTKITGVTTTGTTLLTTTINGLNNGTQYYFAVTAVNLYREGGASAVASATPDPNAAPRTHVYASNSNNGTITTFTVDPLLGVFIPGQVGFYPLTSNSASFLSTDPSGKFVYAPDRAGTGIHVYSPNQLSGALTEIAGSPFSSGNRPDSITFSADGKYAYVPNNGNLTLSVFSANSQSGDLTMAAGSPYSIGFEQGMAVVVPSGKYVYLPPSVRPNGQVLGFSVNQADGSLSPLAGSPFAFCSGLHSISITPDGSFVLGSCFDQRLIEVYAINANTGALTQVPGSPFATTYEPGPIKFSQDGKFVYVLLRRYNSITNNLSYVVEPFVFDGVSGVLNAMTISPIEAGTDARSMAITPAGKFAYVNSESENKIYAYSIDAVSGVIAPLLGSPFEATAPGGIIAP